MAERRVMYQAADGSMWDSAEEADLHDMHAALEYQAKVFMDKHIDANQRTISRKKATDLLVAFSLQMITEGPTDVEDDDDDTEREDAGETQSPGTPAVKEDSE